MAEATQRDDVLERQLEKLFSDFTELPATFRQHPAPRAQPAAGRKLQVTLPFSIKALLLTVRKQLLRPDWLARLEWMWVIELLSILAVLAAIACVLAAPGPAPPTPTAVQATVTSTIPATSTPIPVPALTSAPATDTPTPTSVPATDTSTPTSAPATDTPTPTPTSVPATDTPTLTPTLVPVRRVNPATTTPVAAHAIGLDTIPTPVPRIPLPDKAVNFLLLGSDQRPNESEWRTDVIIIVSVNPDPPSASMLSIPRDTWLYIPNWTYQRINLADVHGAAVGYPGGGPGLVKAAIEYNFGIHVDYYARVDFAGLMRIVDTVGGIDVLLDCPVEDGFPDDPITEDPTVVTQISYPEPGLYHVDGKHALWLARSRRTTSEFARSRRQHRILQAIWAQANQLGLITRLPELWEDLTATVQTDLTLEQVSWLASIGLQLDSSQIHSGFIDGRYLTAWVSPGGASVLLPHTEAILKAMEALFNPYPYQAPQGFSQVEVWNGSGHQDWGLLAADKLSRHGFEVTSIHQADELYERSTLLDFTTSSKGSPVPLLQRLFNANVVHPPSEAESEVPFRLVVGADYQPCEWPTHASWQPTPTPSTPLLEGE